MHGRLPQLRRRDTRFHYIVWRLTASGVHRPLESPYALVNSLSAFRERLNLGNWS